MDMKDAITLFVKIPGLSPVKTRLAETLKAQIAESFHLSAARAASTNIRAASQQAPLQGYYAIAEGSALVHVAWQDMACLWQGEGDGWAYGLRLTAWLSCFLNNKTC